MPDVFSDPFETIKKYLMSLDGVFYAVERNVYLWFYRSATTRHITDMIEQQKPPRHGGRNANHNHPHHPYKRNAAVVPAHQQQQQQQTTYNPYYPQLKQLQQQRQQQQQHTRLLQQQQHQHQQEHQQQFYQQLQAHQHYYQSQPPQLYNYQNQRGAATTAMPLQMQRKPFHSSANSCYFQDNNQYRMNRQYLSEPSLLAPNARNRSNNSSLGSGGSSTIGGSRASIDHQAAYLYEYQLIGDDFFLNLALNDMQARLTNETARSIKRSGLCISGQTIRDAANYVAKLLNPIAEHVIVNIGTVDLLHGHEFVDMKCDFERLMAAFASRHIRPVITTLAPLANHGHNPDMRRRWSMFNAYLLKEFPMLVLDIMPCFVSGNGHTLHDCYQPIAKYVSGSNQPHALWNRVGRQRVLGLLKRQVYETFDAVIDR